MRTRAVTIGALLLLAPGCQTILGIDDPQRGQPDLPDAGGDPADAGEPGFSASLLTTSLTIPIDGQTFFEIEVERVGGFTGDVTIDISGAPSGVDAVELVIPDGETTGELLIGALAPRAIGDTVSFDIAAESGGLADSIPVTDVPITGTPSTPDLTFGPNGNNSIFGVSFGSDDGGRFKDCLVAADGKITAIGFGDGGLGGNSQAAIRLLPNGTADSSWNGGNLARDSFETGSTAESARAVSGGFQGDGRFISIGTHSGNSMFPADLGLMRYSLAGAVGDLNFGNFDNGKSRLDLGDIELITDGLVLSNSRIVAVGRSGDRAAIAQATSTGNLDSSFSGDGVAIEDIGATSSIFHAVAVDSQGRLVAVGSATVGALPGVAIGRLNADGTLDTTFGDGGFVFDVEDFESGSARAVALRPDGRILIGVVTATGGGSAFDVGLKQYLEDGSVDPSFGEDGAVVVDAGGTDTVVDLVLQPDGRALVLVDVTNDDPVLLRFRKDGALDTTFSDDGIADVFFGDVPDAQAMALSDTSRVVVCGGNLGGVPGPGTFGIVSQIWF